MMFVSSTMGCSMVLGSNRPTHVHQETLQCVEQDQLATFSWTQSVHQSAVPLSCEGLEELAPCLKNHWCHNCDCHPQLGATSALNPIHNKMKGESKTAMRHLWSLMRPSASGLNNAQSNIKVVFEMTPLVCTRFCGWSEKVGVGESITVSQWLLVNCNILQCLL